MQICIMQIYHDMAAWLMNDRVSVLNRLRNAVPSSEAHPGLARWFLVTQEKVSNIGAAVTNERLM